MPGDAERLFSMVRGDVSLDAHGATAGPSASGSGTAAPETAASAPASAESADPVAAVALARVRLTVQNGSGIAGRATTLTTSLRNLGYDRVRNGFNAPAHQSRTTLAFPVADRSAAEAVAAALHLPEAALRSSAAVTLPTLTVGTDWPTGSVYPTVVTPSAGAVPTTAAHQSGNQSKCAKVNPVYTW
jgi:hypothetical protein